MTTISTGALRTLADLADNGNADAARIVAHLRSEAAKVLAGATDGTLRLLARREGLAGERLPSNVTVRDSEWNPHSGRREVVVEVRREGR